MKEPASFAGHETQCLDLQMLGFACSTLLAYNGQKGADEVQQRLITQSAVCLPIGTGLGKRTRSTPRCERLGWIVPQTVQVGLSKAYRAVLSLLRCGVLHEAP